MNPWMAVTGLLLLACANSVPAKTEVNPEMLRFRLAARVTYSAGGPISIHFTLENLSDQAIQILTWYTPLEGLKGKIFRVTRDGNSIDYNGRMVKRGKPTPADYVRVAPRSSVSAEVDLTTAYDFSVAGMYRVEFVGHLHDVVVDTGTPAIGEPHALDLVGSSVDFRVLPR